MARAPSESCGDTNISHWSFCSPKLFVYILAACVILLILFQIQYLDSPGSPSSSSPSWPLIHSWKAVSQERPNCSHELLALAEKLSDAVTFLPLKDLRYAQTAQQGHTWFMSSLYDTHVEGEVQYQQYPSAASRGRLLCIKGRDTHDGARNSYALAWTDALPRNATFLTGLTFVSYNHYDYDNIWHGLSAMVPFVAWHLRDGQCAVPARWVLYHWGELRIKMGPWVKSLMEVTFGGSMNMEEFGDSGDEGVACFEEAVVMRHNEGGMSRERRLEVYDMMRCKAREYCNVRNEGRGLAVIGLTMLMRTGARSFRNESAVVGIFQRECGKVEGCNLTVAYAHNLTFCQQVKLMSLTDIVVSAHGAQLTNLFLMDKNSSVMEFFPKGWLKLAGVGQYVFHWFASWSGMKHEGAWRDPNGDDCPYPEDDRRCMSIYKNGRIGYNDTFFEEWARNVLMKVKTRKMEEALNKNTTSVLGGCACS
ncbi:uncharacterized protein LOC117927134 [Vitis riparia]|nr:uncharacterized protein LOC117927134 [Vitis riparia]